MPLANGHARCGRVGGEIVPAVLDHLAMEDHAVMLNRLVMRLSSAHRRGTHTNARTHGHTAQVKRTHTGTASTWHTRQAGLQYRGRDLAGAGGVGDRVTNPLLLEKVSRWFRLPGKGFWSPATPI